MTYQQWKDSVYNFFKKANLLENKNDVLLSEQLRSDFAFHIQNPEDDNAESSGEEEGENKKKKTRKGKTLNRLPTVPFVKLLEKLEKGMQHYFIVDKAEGLKSKSEKGSDDHKKTHKGKFEGIIITASKAHNRFVTTINNLQYLGIDQKKLLDYFRNKFNTSGSVKGNKIKG